MKAEGRAPLRGWTEKVQAQSTPDLRAADCASPFNAAFW
jgi:hypothetical protein